MKLPGKITLATVGIAATAAIGTIATHIVSAATTDPNAVTVATTNTSTSTTTPVPEVKGDHGQQRRRHALRASRYE